MARTINEIYNSYLTEIAADPDLSALNSPSATAIYKKWAFVSAVLHHLLETIFDVFKTDITAIADRKQYGHLSWWADKIKEYQHGDLLQFLNNVFQYAAIDEAKKVVKVVSVTDARGLVLIKAAGLENGRPVQLPVNQVNGLQDYAEEIRPAGTSVIVQSLPADLLKIRLSVYYNAAADLDVVRANVEAAVLNYLYTQIIFDGVFYVNRLVDAIQAVPGITNEQVEVLEIACKSDGEDFKQVTSKVQAKSGYFEIDPAQPLSATITYLT